MLDQHHDDELTPAQREKQSVFESIDYYKSYSSIYMAHLWRGFGRQHGVTQLQQRSAAQRLADRLEKKATMTRWALHVAIAIAVGVVSWFVLEATANITDWRIATLEKIVEHASNAAEGYFVGICFWIVTGTALVTISAVVVVFFEPAAGGSGIPEVMAYLNGIAVPKVVSLRTFVGKVISTIGSVSGGLPVGAEAPLIHLGAIVGAGVTQGRSRTLGCQTDFFREFRTQKDKRDFITAGAACGVSAAFGAPIGGLLFVMEEVSSFWDLAATSQVFLGTIICFTVIAIINTFSEATTRRGFVSNKASVMFEVEYAGDTALNTASILPAALLGLLCGLLGVLFTKCNLRVVRWRRENIKPFRSKRLLEPIFCIILFSFLSFTLPYFMPCESTVNADAATNHLNVTDNTNVQSWHTENSTQLGRLLCDREQQYSPLATLTVKGVGKGAIRRLFSRRTVGEFPFGTVFVFFALYFSFSCYINGAAIASGMVVPMVVMGAAIGRMYGLVLVHLFADTVRNGQGNAVRAYFADQAWMDPGVFALIGAGAFLGGVSRMTISISVIMVELSGELHYLLPIMVAIITSKATADVLCEPLYNQLMHLDFIPYLPTEVPGVNLELITAGDVCSEGAVCLQHHERVPVVIDALQTSHHCFPVVKRSKFIGVATREDLQILLALPQFQARANAAAAQQQQQQQQHFEQHGTRRALRPRPVVVDVANMRYEDWLNHKMSLFFVQGSKEWHANWSPEGIAQRERDRAAATPPPPATIHAPSPLHHRPSSTDEGGEELSNPAPRVTSPEAFLDLPRDDSIVMDLEPIINHSAWSVGVHTNCHMVFQLFRTMGLRHIIVTDGDRVAGMITRKDLLPHELRLKMRHVVSQRFHLQPPSPSAEGLGDSFDGDVTRGRGIWSTIRTFLVGPTRRWFTPVENENSPTEVSTMV
jgi:H+/Cl- antiporter ClcA